MVSIHQCVDSIDFSLSNGTIKHNQTPFIIELRNKLLAIQDDPQPSNLQPILHYLQTSEYRDEFPFIEDELEKIIAKTNRLNEQKLVSHGDKFTLLYNQMQTNFLHSAIEQYSLPALGSSRGECYGFVRGMVDSRFSPYKTNQPIKLTRAIHEYQRNQSDPIKDQQRIKQQRITIEHFCPNLQKRAAQLYSIASQHLGDELCVDLRNGWAQHSTYLSVQKNGDIRYMDPNSGAYLFKKKSDFIVAYQLIGLVKRSKWKFYSISRLIEDPHLQYSSSNTWRGKMRSLLTGKKYEYAGKNPNCVFSDADIRFYFFRRMIAGVSVFSCLGIAFMGTIGLYLGIMIGLTFGYVLHQAKEGNHRGLLGPYHYIRVQLYLCSEWLQEKLGYKNDWENLLTRACSQSQLNPVSLNIVHSNTSPQKKEPVHVGKYYNDEGNIHSLIRLSLFNKASSQSREEINQLSNLPSLQI